MGEPTGLIERLVAVVGEGAVIVDEATTTKLSRDYAWYSPALRGMLADKRADVVVKVASEEALEAVIAICVDTGTPLTIRGGATGNYGQCTRLEGGVLIDINGLDEVIEIGDGWVEAQVGVRMQPLENAVRQHGWELRSYPSTWVKSTLGGYIGGGSGGIGSVTWGRLSEGGTIKAIDILTVENPPRRYHLGEEQALDVQHTYGSNAVLRRITLRLAPKRAWRQIMVTGEDWFALLAFSLEIADDSHWNKRLVSTHEWPIPGNFKGIRKWIREGAHLTFFEIDEQQAVAFKALAEERGFEITHEIAPQEPRRAPMYSDYTYNHTTLWALKADPDLSYMGNRFDISRYEEQMRAIKQRFPDEVWWHLEFLRDIGNHCPMMVGITLFKYTTAERFEEMRSFFEHVGVSAGGSHSPFLDEGVHAHNLQNKFAVKDFADPHGLLNPGKIKSYEKGTHGTWVPLATADS